MGDVECFMGGRGQPNGVVGPLPASCKDQWLDRVRQKFTPPGPPPTATICAASNGSDPDGDDGHDHEDIDKASTLAVTEPHNSPLTRNDSGDGPLNCTGWATIAGNMVE